MAVASGTLSATADGAPGIRRDAAISPLRRLRNGAWWGVCGLAMALLIAPVVWIVEYVVRGAASVWHWSIFTLDSTGVGGGLRNAIVGTLWLTLGVGVLTSLIGIGSGIFLAEFAGRSVFSTLLRSATEVLSGIPSIVFGYCGYLALVVGLHWGFSALPAMIVLALLVVPYVAKSTELALNQVPLAYREGGEALGMSKALVLRRLVMRSAIPGILTGLIIALAISIGETAPLIYTAGFSNSLPKLDLLHNQVGYLTYASWTFYDQPSAAVQALAKEAGLLLVFLVVVFILSSRLIVRMTQRYSPNRVGGGGRRSAAPSGAIGAAGRQSRPGVGLADHRQPGRHRATLRRSAGVQRRDVASGTPQYEARDRAASTTSTTWGSVARSRVGS